MSAAAPREVNDDITLWDRIAHTPLREAWRGQWKARPTIHRMVRAAGLPAPIAKLVLAVVRHTRLWRREKREVARELINHFLDGLEARQTPQQLVEDFGDGGRAAALIRRAKKRMRPLWWRTGRRSIQALLLLPLLLLALYIPIAIRFFAGAPVITHDYLADLNRAPASVPAEQRAWPVYRRALMGLPPIDSIVPDQARPHPAAVKPGDPHWPAYRQFVQQHADRIALVRAAAAMPGFGFQAAPRLTEEDQKLWPQIHPSDDHGGRLPPLYGALLPYLPEMRRLAMLLVIDARRAAEAGDADTALADLNAIMGIAVHTREAGLLINDLVALAIFQLLLDRAGEFLAHQPQLFSDEHLLRLAHRLATFTDDVLRVRLGSERLGFYDIVQRTYTSDGGGNGRITFQGMRLLDLMLVHADGSRGPVAEGGPILAATPVMAMIALDRRELLAEYDHWMSDMERSGALPLWQRDGSVVGNLVATWDASPIERWRRLALVRLLPAVDTASLQHHYVRAGRDGVLVAIALELHRRRHGDWPATLGELTPSLLPQVPADPYDGRPLRYRVVNAQPVVYSVGVDRDDDGGRPPRGAGGAIDYSLASRWTLNPPAESDGDWILWPR